MENGSGYNTLLPYLDVSNPIHIQLVRSPSVEEGSLDFPFVLLDDLNPFSHSFEAYLITDAGSCAKRLLISIQRDNYGFPSNSISKPTNDKIDDLWQRSFQRYIADDDTILIKNQVDQCGKLSRSSPLFYCRFKNTFFHPLCPACGTNLVLCTENQLLADFGLQQYSESLRRYIYCRNCSMPEKLFYSFSKSVSDPPMVRDRFELVGDFMNVFQYQDPGQLIPCVSCCEQDQCFRSGKQAASRIVPVSFYPFYFFIHETPSLQAVDFLRFVSSAPEVDVRRRIESENPTRLRSLDEFSSKKANRPYFFFDGEDRLFLEILYIKLAFLTEVFRLLYLTKTHMPDPGQSLCLERIWVDVKDQHSKLPLFWNFRVKVIEPFGSADDLAILGPKDKAATGIYCFALLWFYTLLSNRNVGFSDIKNAVERISNQIENGDGTPSSDRGASIAQDPIISPKNTFWGLNEKVICDVSERVWARAVEIGRELLSLSLNKIIEFPASSFLTKMESIEGEIKSLIFTTGKEDRDNFGMPKSTGSDEENADILKILNDIIKNWKRLGSGSKPKPAEPKVKETMIHLRIEEDRRKDESSQDLEDAESPDGATPKPTIIVSLVHSKGQEGSSEKKCSTMNGDREDSTGLDPSNDENFLKETVAVVRGNDTDIKGKE